MSESKCPSCGATVLPDELVCPECTRFVGAPDTPAERVFCLDTDVRTKVAGVTSTPKPVLNVLASDSDERVRDSVAGNPCSPEAALDKLACDPIAHVRAAVAGNYCTHPQTLRSLASDPESSVREALAGNFATPDDVCLQLASDPDPDVRKNLAYNCGLPESILLKLASDPDPEVRGGLTENDELPEDIWVTLASDPDSSVRRSVAFSLDPPASALEVLLDDDDRDVRRRACEKAGMPDKGVYEQAEGSDPEVRAEAARDPYAPADVLCALASDPWIDVRKAVAGNKSTPPEALETLASDEVSGVRHAVACNESAPSSALATLMGDWYSDIRESAQHTLASLLGTDALKPVMSDDDADADAEPLSAATPQAAAKRTLLVLVPFNEEHFARLAEAAGADWVVEQHAHGLAGAELEEALARADAVVGEPDAVVLNRAGSHLKMVQMTWAGTDKYTRSGLPFPEGVALCNAVGGFGHIISQYVLAQTLSIMQNLPGYRAQQLAGVWADRGPVASLEGANVLVFGAGDIGGHIAKRMSGFDAHVAGVCRNVGEPRPYFERLVTLDEAEALLPGADVVACSIPNSDETAHYLDERRLRLMKEGAVLVNVGRGNFIDNMALAQVLADGHLRGAALDVTDPEPLPAGHPLWSEPRCLVTPHVSGGSFGRHPGTENRICDICCENLRRLNAGEPLKNRVL